MYDRRREEEDIHKRLCEMIVDCNYGLFNSLNLGKVAKPQYATELQNETVSLIRSSFRTEMSNFSNSIKYVGNILNFQVFPVENKRGCATAHLFGFSQQSGLRFRPQMRLQNSTQKYMMELGAMIRSSSSINHAPEIPTKYSFINISFIEGDNPSNCEKQYTAYCSHLRRLRKAQRRGGDD